MPETRRLPRIRHTIRHGTRETVQHKVRAFYAVLRGNPFGYIA